MGRSINRRTLLQLGGAAAAMTALPAWAQEQRQISMMWWGGQNRMERTLKAIDEFVATQPGLDVQAESLGSTADYFVSLTTKIAGGGAPDIMQLGYSQIAEYAQRGVLEPLDDYVGNELDISDWPASSVDSLRVDGKLYGINLGNNTTTMYYDKDAYAAAGFADIAIDSTWDQWFDMAEAVTKAGDGSFFGMSDGSGNALVFENYVRQKGFQLYDGQAVGVGQEVVTEWFDMWAAARERGAIPPADVAALDIESIAENLLIQGRAGTNFGHSNQVVALQSATPKPLGMAMYPQGAGDTMGQFIRPSQHLSIWSGSQHKSDAVSLANFLVMNPTGVKILGVERGVPSSPSMQAILAPELDDITRQSLDFVAAVTPVATPIPPPPPRGASEVETKFRELSQQVSFGQIDTTEAGRIYVEDSNAILARA
ncbi:ABC transporter substrate-binding protein [Devosia sediminis]|uniref:Extracellular solute-binding protein n=1 Tax=Devosia sediminis TaxID=2798801 RepID=A0A934MHD0_9HYPH|nr:extracellular solute-binding protein [Devosia sediminis]MBJ3784952.1 extracellular solute-binding protein [Devosia sediminis]